jgi:hypothetical protein
LFEEYLEKQVLIIESGESTTGILKQIFYNAANEVISVKLETNRGDVIIPYPFKLKHQNGVNA